jgi:outer membrane protein assembly factor BamB
VTDSTVFTTSAKGVITALNRSTGEVVWEVNIGDRPTAGISGDDRLLYIGTGDGRIYSIDQQDGSVVWNTTVSSEVIAPPSAGRDSVVVRSIDGRVYALNKNNGNRQWIYSYTVPALSLHGNGRPLVVPDGVLVGLDNGRLAALRASDGEVFWEARLSDSTGRSEIDRLNDLDGDVVIAGNSIYAVNYQGAVAQIDPASGQRRWSADVSSAVGLDANGNMVVVTDEFDTVHAYSVLDGLGLWQQEDLSNRQLTAPAITGSGDVVVGDFEGYLHVLSGASGAQIGRIKATDGQITHKPVIVDNIVYLLGRDGGLSAVAL